MVVPEQVEAGDLDCGEDAADDERRRHEVLGDGGAEVRGAGDDDGWRYDARQHGEGVLEAEEEGQQHGHAVVEAEERGRAADLAHEGEVGAEEEGIVVVAYEAFSRDLIS